MPFERYKHLTIPRQTVALAQILSLSTCIAGAVTNTVRLASSEIYLKESTNVANVADLAKAAEKCLRERFPEFDGSNVLCSATIEVVHGSPILRCYFHKGVFGPVWVADARLDGTVTNLIAGVTVDRAVSRGVLRTPGGQSFQTEDSLNWITNYLRTNSPFKSLQR